MVTNLLNNHEVVIRHFRVDLETCLERDHDVGTNDFLAGAMEKHEKMAWMLRAFVESK
jgi:starvation-inducible DNA-binding protein